MVNPRCLFKRMNNSKKKKASKKPQMPTKPPTVASWLYGPTEWALGWLRKEADLRRSCVVHLIEKKQRSRTSVERCKRPVQASSLQSVCRPCLELNPLICVLTDVQLPIFANMLGVPLFLLVVLHHYMAVNSPEKQEWKWRFLCPWVPGHSLKQRGGCEGSSHFIPFTHHNIQSNYTWIFPNNFYFLKVFLNPTEQEAPTE